MSLRDQIEETKELSDQLLMEISNLSKRKTEIREKKVSEEGEEYLSFNPSAKKELESPTQKIPTYFYFQKK